MGAFGNDISMDILSFGEAIKQISHRGPDNQAYKQINEYLLLGHTRLSIIDVNNRSNQPFEDKNGNVLVFNGEIYNYKELKTELAEYIFNTNSDTEVLINLLDKYSIDIVLNKLNGMFAFLYWDNKKKKLIVARDRIGKKPLFFTEQNNKVYFSSEAKTFSKLGIDFKISDKAIINFLFDRNSGIGEDTFFDNVKSIENAHYYIFEIKNSNIKYKKMKYYSLEYIKTDNAMTYKEAKDGFSQMFKESLNLRMRSDVPIAFMLSGGLDSSSIISQIAHDNPTQHLTAISAIYPNTRDDESEYAQAVIDKYKNIKKEFIEISADDFFQYLDNTIYAQETPIADGSMVAHNILMNKISDLGIKVILSGNGGDEVLAGYNTHQHAYDAYLISKLKISQLKINDYKYGLYHLLPDFIKEKIKNRLALQKNFLNDNTKLKMRYAVYNEAFNDGDIINFYLKMSLSSWTIPGFIWYDDRNAMQYGVESRSPFLDYKLIEWMMKVPGNYKLDKYFTKKVLRDTMQGILPDKVLNRVDKKGFHSPIKQYEKYIDYNEILNDKEFIKTFYYLNIKTILEDEFIYRWRLFSIYKWYKIFIVGVDNG
jgi:asparagine synthase (glutamine-hydrolysing)